MTAPDHFLQALYNFTVTGEHPKIKSYNTTDLGAKNFAVQIKVYRDDQVNFQAKLKNYVSYRGVVKMEEPEYPEHQMNLPPPKQEVRSTIPQLTRTPGMGVPMFVPPVQPMIPQAIPMFAPPSWSETTSSLPKKVQIYHPELVLPSNATSEPNEAYDIIFLIQSDKESLLLNIAIINGTLTITNKGQPIDVFIMKFEHKKFTENTYLTRHGGLIPRLRYYFSTFNEKPFLVPQTVFITARLNSATTYWKHQITTKDFLNYEFEHLPVGERSWYEVLSYPKGLRAYLDIDYMQPHAVFSTMSNLIDEIVAIFKREYDEVLDRENIIVLRAFPDKIDISTSTLKSSFHMIIRSKWLFASVIDIYNLFNKYNLLQIKGRAPIGRLEIADPLVYKLHQKFRLPYATKTVNDVRTFQPVSHTDFMTTTKKWVVTDMMIQVIDRVSEFYPAQKTATILDLINPIKLLTDAQYNEICAVAGLNQNYSKIIETRKYSSRMLRDVASLLKTCEYSPRTTQLFVKIASDLNETYQTLYNSLYHDGQRHLFAAGSGSPNPLTVWEKAYKKNEEAQAYSILISLLKSIYDQAVTETDSYVSLKLVYNPTKVEGLRKEAVSFLLPNYSIQAWVHCDKNKHENIMMSVLAPEHSITIYLNDHRWNHTDYRFGLMQQFSDSESQIMNFEIVLTPKLMQLYSCEKIVDPFTAQED